MGFVLFGVFTRGPTGAELIGIGGALLLAFVVVPGVSQVEFGFPAGVKVVTAVRTREETLRRVLEHQKPELQLCAVLMCDDPSAATQLLEAVMSRVVSEWRGPVSPALRVYVFCSLVHLLIARDAWVHNEVPDSRADTDNMLAFLPLPTRIPIVLENFANLPLTEIARITGRPTDDLNRDVAEATTYLNRRPQNRGEGIADGS